MEKEKQSYYKTWHLPAPSGGGVARVLPIHGLGQAFPLENWQPPKMLDEETQKELQINYNNRIKPSERYSFARTIAMMRSFGTKLFQAWWPLGVPVIDEVTGNPVEGKFVPHAGSEGNKGEASPYNP